MLEILDSQHAEANHQFVRFVEDHYEAWMTGQEEAPMLSHRVLPEWLPQAVAGAEGRPVFLVVIDNLRWDQWRTIAPSLRPKWTVAEEKTYYSILPTATQYARNALFAGMTPGDIARLLPNFWIGENEEGRKMRTRNRFNKRSFPVWGWKAKPLTTKSPTFRRANGWRIGFTN